MLHNQSRMIGVQPPSVQATAMQQTNNPFHPSVMNVFQPTSVPAPIMQQMIPVSHFRRAYTQSYTYEMFGNLPVDMTAHPLQQMIPVSHFRRAYTQSYPYEMFGNLPVDMTAHPLQQEEQAQAVGLYDNTSDRWEIPETSLQWIRKIDHGYFGEVWEGLWNNTTQVAIKTYIKGKMDPNDFLLEAQIMMKLQHPNLIRLYGVCTKDERIYIVTELMENGNLLKFLKGQRFALTVPKLIDFLAQIASGMAYLESQNYIHRDLAARNILVGENNIVKIADFGRAKAIEKDEYMGHAGSRFPVFWTDPEVAHNKRYTKKSDVWSFGILMFEILTYGKLPYKGIENDQCLYQKLPPGTPTALYNIMHECLQTDEMKRPTFKTLQWKLQTGH